MNYHFDERLLPSSLTLWLKFPNNALVEFEKSREVNNS